VTSNGLAQGGAEVALTAGPLRANTMSDATGHYRVTGVPEGPVSVTANLGNGFLSGSAFGNLTGDGTTLTLDVPLHDSGAVGGVVVRADGVTPASQSLVSLQVGGSGGGSFSTLTDATGHFSFERLPAGTGSLTVDVLGSIDQGSGTVTIPAGETADVILVLHGVGSIHGIARDSTGAPTAGTVSISGTGTIPYSRTLAVGADGTFALPEVLAGPFAAYLTVQTATFTLYGSASGTVAPDTDAFVAIQVQPTGIVRGRALRSNGTTVALGTEVTLRLLPNRGVLVFNAGNDGRFETSGVPLGDFELRLRDGVSGGVGLVQGQKVAQNGQIVDVGDVVLDDTPIEAVAFDPTAGSLNVAVNRPIQVLFSDRLSSAQGITVSDATHSITTSATLTPDGFGVTLTGTWTDSSDITVTATTGVTDVFGRHPAAPRSATFHTVDLSAPRVASVTPADQAIEVPADASIEVTFNEPLAAATDLGTLVILSGAGGSLLGNSALVSPTVVRFTPSTPLVANTLFTVSVNGAVDAVGNRQTTAFVSHFKTHDTDPPLLALTQPAPGTWVATNKPPITVALSDALSGIDPATGTLALDGTPVTPAKSALALTFTPIQSLGDGTHAVEASVADRAGNLGTLNAELNVDTTPPGPATLGGVATGDVLVGSLVLSATATDSGSGVAKIEVEVDGAMKLTLLEPSFAGTLSTVGFTEDTHLLRARAFDKAGNAGPYGPTVSAYANNLPITVAITAPPVGTRVRQTVGVVATASEPIQRMTFTVGSQTIVDDTSPYAATLDLSGFPESDVTIVATADGFIGDQGTASRSVTIDRTPPGAPIEAKINAEPPENGLSFVHGNAGAVESMVQVRATNDRTKASVTKQALADGSVGLNLPGAVLDKVLLVAIDSAGNESAESFVFIRSTTSLPPVNVALTFLGVLADRMGAGTPALSPDGKRDAVFALDIALGASVTKPLAYIDLDAPKSFSTRPEVGAVVAAAKSELGATFLNDADGQVSASLTGTVTLLLFVPTDGLLQAGATYRATVAFTDGTRFIGTLTLGAVPTEEVSTAFFSVSNAALPFDPSGPPVPPGTAVTREVASLTFSVNNTKPPFDSGGPPAPPGTVIALETVSSTFSVRNEKLPFDAGGPPPPAGTLLALEAVSPTFSARNEKLPFDAGGPPPPAGTLLALEAVSPTFSVRNEKLPFDAGGPPPPAGTVIAFETVSPTFSLLNQFLPFAGTSLLGTEAVSSTFSLNNTPAGAAPLASSQVSASLSDRLLYGLAGSSGLGARPPGMLGGVQGAPSLRGLVAWWPADGNARDSVSGRNANLLGDTEFADGKLGKAFVFNGVDGGVWVPDSQGVTPQEVTLSAWIRLESLGFEGTTSTVIAKQATGEPGTGDGGGEASWALAVDPDGRPLLTLWNGSEVVRVLAPDVLVLGDWHHLAATRSRDLLLLYVDGVEVASAPFYETRANYDIELGAYLTTRGTHPLDGLLDEISIYERALSASEIQGIYQLGSAAICCLNDQGD
jgi:hypothetical protein